MLYIQYINNSVPSLYLHIYSGVPWRREGGGRGEVWGMWKDVTPPSTFQNRIRFMQNIFGKISQLSFFRSVETHPTSSCHLFLSDLSILWQCKGILNSKQNHKFKHTKVASTKPLGLNLYFLTSHFWYRPTTAYICIYNITQVKYL